MADPTHKDGVQRAAQMLLGHRLDSAALASLLAGGDPDRSEATAADHVPNIVVFRNILQPDFNRNIFFRSPGRHTAVRELGPATHLLIPEALLAVYVAVLEVGIDTRSTHSMP